MKILNAEFIRSCTSPEQFPQDRLPEIAFVGRSNVGKSSLINSLLQRKKLAKVSRTPGKTRLLNFFLVRTSDSSLPAFYLVDLPGYGYAKVSKSVRQEWGALLESYLSTRETLRGVVLLIEGRGPGPRDANAAEWLRGIGEPPIIVATKVDQLRQGERQRGLSQIRSTLGLAGDAPLVACSSVTHEGRDELWWAVHERLALRE